MSEYDKLSVDTEYSDMFDKEVKMIKKKKESYCEQIEKDLCCCKVEAIVSVDDRGQMVLSKDISPYYS